MITQWEDKYSLNNEKIDAQHKELFRLAALVELLDDKTTSKEVKELLRKFFDYMKEHFADEEEYMKSINYPLLGKHRNVHREIVDRFKYIIKSHGNSLEPLKKELKKATKNILIAHILDEDLKIEKWRKANA